MRFAILCSALLVAALLCIASAQQSGPVILNSENFEENTKDVAAFIKFYAPWCGHCVALAPTWDTLADKVHSEFEGKAKVGKVDCTVENDLASKYDIRGYPTLLLLKNGEKVPYQGGRDHDSLYAFVKQHVEA